MISEAKDIIEKASKELENGYSDDVEYVFEVLDEIFENLEVILRARYSNRKSC